MNKCFTAGFLRQDLLSIKECWFLTVVRILLYIFFLAALPIKRASYEQLFPNFCPGAWLLALAPQC